MKAEVTLADIKFTPGPWSLVKLTGETYVEAPNGRMIWGPFPCSADDSVDADGALIAAAPDMYAALRDAREYVMELLHERRLQFDGYELLGHVDAVKGCLDRIDMALAKAEGNA